MSTYKETLLRIIPLCLILATSIQAASSQDRPEQGSPDGDLSDRSLTELTRLLSAPQAVTRARAACALADRDYRAEPAADELIELLSDDTPVPWDVCRRAGKHRHWYHGTCTNDWNSCEDTTPGRKAAGALSDIGSSITGRVETVLTDGSDHARRNAAWILGAIDSHGSVELLIVALDDAFSEVREQSAWALGAIDDSRGAASLGALRTDPAADVREAAAWALGAIGQPESVEPLLDYLSDEDAEVREDAAWALGAIGAKQAVDGLQSAVDDPGPEVRENVAWALGAIGSPKGGPALMELLKDDDDEVVENAIWGIGAIDYMPAVERLIALLSHENPNIRENVAWALGAIGDKRAIEPLLAVFQDDDDRDVRRKAMWAIAAIH